MIAAQSIQATPKTKENPTKTIGLISDTHIPTRAKEIPRQVFKVFEDADYIIHAGDLVQLSVIDDLEQFAPVLVVYGNMDGPNIRGKLPKINSLKIFNWKIGVMHNPDVVFGMGKMREIAKTSNFNVMVYGHTHSANVKWEAGTLFVNPGSPTNPIPPLINKPTVALLRVNKERIEPEIVRI